MDDFRKSYYPDFLKWDFDMPLNCRYRSLKEIKRIFKKKGRKKLKKSLDKDIQTWYNDYSK